MWKQWKKAAVVLMACTMLLNMTGCKKQEEKLKEPQTEQKTRQKDEKEAESKEETIPANQNLLTGLADLSETAIGKRPVATIMKRHVRNMELHRRTFYMRFRWKAILQD